MPMEVKSERAVCYRCGTSYGRYKGYFLVSYAAQHRGIGYLPVCKECVDKMYDAYLAQCNDVKKAVRQMCRKLDLYWNESVFETVYKQNTPRTMMTQYVRKINSVTFAGKCYDDTISADGTLWLFGKAAAQPESEPEPVPEETKGPEREIKVPKEIMDFWGPGYTPDMYMALDERYKYWLSRWPDQTENLDIGTEALIRQICSTELDINRSRAAGKDVDKQVTVLNNLIGSANLKPTQRKEDLDLSAQNTPLGVWLYRYENERPLPEIDDDMKDVNGIRRYVFTWLGHVLKMLGVKNGYSQLYEEEVARLRVEKPEYDGDDDEAFMTDIMTDGGDDERE